MSARSKARKRALDILFEADSKSVPVGTVLAEHIRRREQAGDPALNDYSIELVEGVKAHADEIDAAVLAAAHGWTLDRMPIVDRAILRIGGFEVIFNEDVPNAVAISEAVQLATDLSTDESPGFVNGVLGAMAVRDIPAKSTPE
jgi:N utilization substance protein B